MLCANLQTKFGNEPKNQFCDGQKFHSYGTLIAYTKDGKIHLTNSWDYSKTTLYCLSQVLRVSGKADILKGIKEGKYILD